MLFYYINKNVGSVIMSHTPTFIVEPFSFFMGWRIVWMCLWKHRRQNKWFCGRTWYELVVEYESAYMLKI